MNLYHVFRKSDGLKVFAYNTEAGPISFAGYEFDRHDHILQPPVVDPPPRPTAVYGGRRILTRLEFLRLMNQQERVQIRGFSKGNNPVAPIIEDFMFLLEMSQEVNLDDADLVAGLQQLEAGGLLNAGRAAEILNG
jgi:hypothetical protein